MELVDLLRRTTCESPELKSDLSVPVQADRAQRTAPIRPRWWLI